MLKKLRSYLELCRVHVCGLGVLCVIGGLTVSGAALSGKQFVLLYLVHVLTIAWSFAHNDYCDYELDRQASDLQRRVLVRGDVSRSEALILSLVLFTITLLITIISWPGWQPLAILLLLAGCIVVYNRFSKSFIGADPIFALAGALFILLGAAAVMPGYSLLHAPALTWIVFAVSFLDHWHFNAVLGGLKDVVTDRRHGCKTIACAGTVVADDGSLTFRPQFRAIAWALNLVVVFLYFLPVLAFDHPASNTQLAVMALTSAIMLLQVGLLFRLRQFDRRRIEALTRQRELASKAVMVSMLFSWAGEFWVLMLMTLPMAFYMVLNSLMNGHPFRLPQEF